MHDNFSRFQALIVVALLCMAAAACQKPDEVPPPQPVINGERIAFPQDGKQTALLKSVPAEAFTANTVTVPGRLAWNENRTSRIFSPVGGRVVALPVTPGQAVKAGQMLAGISSPEFGQAQAEVRRAETDLRLAQKNLARTQELNVAGVIPDKDVQAAAADRERAQAERDRTLAREKLYGRSDGSAVDQQFRLTSPIAGIVVERNLNPGQEVRPDQAQPTNPPLFVVTDPTALWAQLDLPESLLETVRPGMSIVLRAGAFPNEKFSARIDFVADAIDAASRTVKARASVANPGRRLKSEMFVNADVATPSETEPKVPASAVLLIGDKQYVFIELGDLNYERRVVTADQVRLGLMRLHSGVNAGEKVVVEGALLLQQLLAARTRQ